MSRVPRLLSSCDLKSLPLTPADAFLLSRIDAAASEQDLVLLTGFPEERVATMLDRLAALGAIALTGGSASQVRLRATPDPAASADVDLMRRRALARKLSGTYARSAPASPVPPPDPAADAAVALRASEALHAHHEEAAAQARRAEIARSLDEGSAALARADFAAAIRAHRLAASLAPDEPEVQATCARAFRLAAAAFADACWEQALAEERDERWEDAALSYARVCAGRPDDARAHERVANAALRAGHVRRAVEFARRSIELAPGSALFRVTLARAYAAAGLEKSSRGELDRALALAHDDARIHNLVSRVRSLSPKAGEAV